ncbi:MAG: hypothetical protein ACRECJ_01380, partial [Limisphaerales bacterium]
MVKRLVIYVCAAVILSAGFSLAQNTEPPTPPSKPSRKTKAIPIPSKEALRISRLKALEAQRKYEKSGFVLGDSVFLEEPPEVEKSYRSRIASGDRVA